MFIVVSKWLVTWNRFYKVHAATLIVALHVKAGWFATQCYWCCSDRIVNKDLLWNAIQVSVNQDLAMAIRLFLYGLFLENLYCNMIYLNRLLYLDAKNYITLLKETEHWSHALICLIMMVQELLLFGDWFKLWRSQFRFLRYYKHKFVSDCLL